jgi:hypothetical protein
MGLGRRIVRKTVRKATPRPVRQASHPVRTVERKVTPRPVRQAGYAVHNVTHPVAAAENKAIGAVLNGGRRRHRKRGWLSALFSGKR